MFKARIIHDMFSRVYVVFQMAGSILNAVSERVFTLRVRANYSTHFSPLPLRPTNLKSLKRATWFFITAVALRSSAAKFSSLPAAIETRTPSGISPSATTLNATGSVLLHLQCDGNTLQTKFGESVFTSSPGYSASASMSDRSPLIFRGPAFSVAVVMVLQCVNHKPWATRICVASLAHYRTVKSTEMLLANHSPAILTSVVPTCFAFYMMYKLLANSEWQLNLVTRPPLAFVQWAHVLRIPMYSLWTFSSVPVV